MSLVLLIGGVLIVALVAFIATRGSSRLRSGPHNNWRNEDFLSRGAAGSWTEGATYSKSEPKDVYGLGL